MRQADHTEAGQWLARHGLADAEPTPLLAARLAVRRRANIANSLLLAAFLLGAALTRVLALPTHVTPSWLPLLVLTALVVGLLVAQWLLGWWVRRVDRRAGAQLSRRVAHPVELGWPAVLGRPYAVFTVASFTGALLLAVSVLPVSDSGLRSGRSSC
jgi:MFS family permease